MKKIGIIMGSKSDMPIVEKATAMLDKLGVGYELRILSAHRTPDEVASFALHARMNGIGVIIAAAGKAAALPGAVAACTTLPVIGLPIKSSFLDGLDSLLSMTQMPSGVPVATVGTDAAQNAAILAAEIIAVYDETVEKALADYKEDMKNKVLEADSDIRKDR